MEVDLIIPLYNKKNYIGKCLISALNQEKCRFNKIIVVNDGSTDHGEDEVKKLIKKNNNIHLLNQKNLGSSAARNNGINVSKSKYLVFLDADDLLHKKYLLSLKLMQYKYPDIKVYSARHLNIYNNLELIKNSNKIKLYKSKIIKLDNPILKYSLDPKIFCSSGICIERKIFNEIKFPEGANVGEDIYTWLKIFKSNKMVYYDKELIFIFKVSENRSIDIFKEIPFYLKKISEFNFFKNKSYFFYFLISSIIYLYQNKEKTDSTSFLQLIKKQSNIIYIILIIINNTYLFNFYKTFKNRRIKEENLKKYPDIKNFYILSANYLFVLPGIPIIIFTLYWSKNYVLISDILLMSSITIFITSSISFYARPFALISDNLKDAIIFLKIKGILTFPIILILISIKQLLNIEGFTTLNVSIFYLVYIWINEANIAIIEFENSKKKLIYNLIKNISITGLLVINILFKSLELEIVCASILLILLILSNLKNINLKSYSKVFLLIKKFVNENWIYISLNSFILNLTNFLHRYTVLSFVDKTYAGVLFFCFSIGSFPANLFNFVFSSTIIRNKSKVPLLGVLSLVIYIGIALYIIILHHFKIESSVFFNIFQKEHLDFIFYSMIGGMIMTYALFKKSEIFLEDEMKKIFLPELLYSLIILSIIPLIFYNFDINKFKYIFLLNSIVAFLIFVPLQKNLKNE